MDLFKAYECLPQDLIIAKFEAYDFDNISLKFFHSYFSNLKQKLKIGSAISYWIDILARKNQCSNLGPLIIIILLTTLCLLKNLTFATFGMLILYKSLAQACR